jgi:hypothetical protein
MNPRALLASIDIILMDLAAFATIGEAAIILTRLNNCKAQVTEAAIAIEETEAAIIGARQSLNSSLFVSDQIAFKNIITQLTIRSQQLKVNFETIKIETQKTLNEAAVISNVINMNKGVETINAYNRLAATTNGYISKEAVSLGKIINKLVGTIAGGLAWLAAQDSSNAEELEMKKQNTNGTYTPINLNQNNNTYQFYPMPSGGGLTPLYKVDPLIIDLDGNGFNLTNEETGAYFDLDKNGFAESTGWVSGNDIVLAMDRDNNGFIDNGGELFGDQTILKNGQSAVSGVQALAGLDINLDGKHNNIIYIHSYKRTA